MKTLISKIEKESKLYKVVVMPLFFISVLFSDMSLFSQNVIELKSAINSFDKSVTSSDQIKAKHLKSLAYELNPMFIYKNSRIVSISDEKPIVGEIEFSQIQSLYLKNSLYESVEFLRIMVSNPNQISNVLNINLLSHFKSLKYILFVCAFKCTPNFVESLFIPDLRVSVFYSQEIPE